MTTKAQKITPNLTLKLAIVASGRTQREIAERARIPEVRLSKLVTGREDATLAERARLARVLHRKRSDLFPVGAAPVALLESEAS